MADSERQIPDDQQRWQAWNLLGELEDSYLAIAALQTALDLRLFETLASAGPRPIAGLAAEFGTSDRGIRAIVSAMASLGLLQLSASTVGLSAAGAAYLDPASPGYYGDTLRAVTLSRRALDQLTDAVVSGSALGDTGPASGALWAQDIANSLIHWQAESERAMTAWQQLGVLDAGWTRMVDLGCGSGTRTLPLLQRLPDARLDCVDWHQEVLDVCAQVARELGVQDRTSFRRADLRTVEFEPESIDLVHASAVLYFYPVQELPALLARIQSWLKPGGVFVSRHLLAQDDRSGPREAVMRDVQMFLFHPSGYVPTESQSRAALAEAGFTDVRIVDSTYAVAAKPH